MKYVALRECNYDRTYSPGEEVDASVIDASIVQNAIALGFLGTKEDKKDLRKQIEEKDTLIEQLSQRAEDAEKRNAELRAQLEAMTAQTGEQKELDIAQEGQEPKAETEVAQEAEPNTEDKANTPKSGKSAAK